MTSGNIMAGAPGTLGAALSSAGERAARVDLAIAYRLFDWLGITDVIHTHISVRVPGEKECFLQLPYGHLFREARASSMVKCDVEGRIISDPTGLGISLGGFCIHSAIHMGNANAECVMHAHSEATVAVANYRDGLLPLSQHALRFYGKVAYFGYSGLFDSAQKRAALPRALGDRDVLMLRNHGPLVVGKSVRECFSRMYYLERACRMQVATLSQCRDPRADLVWVDERHCEEMAKAFENGDAVMEREWNALVRMLKETSPGYDQ
jgi:ribulose-5-phosphate 4-epimerase/fuculose-1-phosphate aldolase